MVDTLTHDPNAEFLEVEPIKPADPKVDMDTPRVDVNAIWAQINGNTPVAEMGPEIQKQLDPAMTGPDAINLKYDNPEPSQTIDLSRVEQVSYTNQIAMAEGTPAMGDGVAKIGNEIAATISGIFDSLRGGQTMEPNPEMNMNGPPPPAMTGPTHTPFG